MQDARISGFGSFIADRIFDSRFKFHLRRLPVSLRTFRKGYLLFQYTAWTRFCQHRKTKGGHRNDPVPSPLSGLPQQLFLWKDLQSVHWSTVGLASCVPTVMLSSAQYSAPVLWLAH